MNNAMFHSTMVALQYLERVNVVDSNVILLIDREPDELMHLTDVLKDDYTVYAENNKNDALETAKKVVPDLILLDIMVLEPGEMLNALNTEIPIIVLLEDDHIDDDANDEFMTGAVDYIQRPLPSVVVKSRVRTHMSLVMQKKLIGQLVDHTRGPEFFKERLTQEWRRAARDETKLSMLFISINNFYGYGENQKRLVVKCVAEAIKINAKRAMDISTRWDKDIFLALLPNTPSYGAAILAEMIRKNIEKTPIKLDESGTDIHSTVTIYTCSSKPDADTDAILFLEDAMKTFKKVKDHDTNTVLSI